MSRKGLFNIDAPDGDPLKQTEENRPARLSPMRMRPILGSPELLSGEATRPVGAIGQSLSEYSEKAKRADEIEKKLALGQVIVELDPGVVEPSFINDRMPVSANALSNLVEAIREQGQLNPILVRPHPEKPGQYQVAFGHRRLRALALLERPVRAIIRELTDEQLVIAQGQENNERKDLSYIEKARFAHLLEQRFSRATIMSAMSVYKSDLSNMLSVASKIPEEVVSAIGPAPGIGRRGWIELAAAFVQTSSAESARRAALNPELQKLDSDERFKSVLAATKPEATATHYSENWATPDGLPLARIVQDEGRISLIVDKRKSPQFADFVVNRLRDIFLEFEARSKAG